MLCVWRPASNAAGLFRFASFLLSALQVMSRIPLRRHAQKCYSDEDLDGRPIDQVALMVAPAVLKTENEGCRMAQLWRARCAPKSTSLPWFDAHSLSLLSRGARTCGTAHAQKPLHDKDLCSSQIEWLPNRLVPAASAGISCEWPLAKAASTDAANPDDNLTSASQGEKVCKTRHVTGHSLAMTRS